MTYKTKSKRFFEHLLFWLMYWAFVSFSSGLYDLDFATISLYTLLNLPLTISVTYLFVYAILPFYIKKKLIPFIGLTVILLMVALLLKRLSVQYIHFPLLYGDTDWTFSFFNWYKIVGYLVQLCATIGLVSAIRMYRNWKRTNDKLTQIQVEKRNLELSYLKAQMSPHFVFNTLNSIYYDVVNKHENAANSIVQFSDLLRVVLYDCATNEIPIQKEIELINNYIALQKSRYQNRLTVHFEIVGDTTQKIPPLIAFSLVENAFKHGMSESIGNCSIEISMRIESHSFHLLIKNPISESTELLHPDSSAGLGLKNVHRQLSLIYGTAYTLTHEAIDSTYACHLTLPFLST